MADWAAIKHEYITTAIGLRALAEKHGVSVSSTKKRCMREKWVDARRQFVREVEAIAVDEAKQETVDHLAVVRRGAERLAALAGERMETVTSTQDMRNLSFVLRETGAMLRDFYDAPTPKEAEARRIAAERLELDVQKARAGDAGEDGVVKVEFTGEEEKWAE